MKYLMCFLMPLLLSGCFVKKEILRVPIECDIQKTERPKASGDFIKDLKAVMIYTEILERDLKYCRGEK